MILLLTSLRPESIIEVIESLLLEQKILLVSDEQSKLAPVAEGLLRLLQPFQ